jgi:hypothetical protein
MYQNCLVNTPKYSKLCMYRYGELTFSYSLLSVWTLKLRFLAKLLHIPKRAKNVEQLYCISIFNAKNLSCTVGMYIMNQKDHKKYRYVKNAQICEKSKKSTLVVIHFYSSYPPPLPSLPYSPPLIPLPSPYPTLSSVAVSKCVYMSLVMSTIPKRKYKRSDIEANYRNKTKTF